MHLNLEPKPILSVCLNAAWQKTLTFSKVTSGAVNRARESHDAGGGKGVNVARVLRLLNFPVALASFTGGTTGDCLKAELRANGVEDLTVPSQGRTRCCYTIIDETSGNATELIEPSAKILPEEANAMRRMLLTQLPRFSAVALCGSLPPGVSSEIYADVVSMCRRLGIPAILDAVADIGSTLEAGPSLVKINADELAQLTAVLDNSKQQTANNRNSEQNTQTTDISGQGCHAKDIPSHAQLLLARYPLVRWLAVTDGAAPAWLFQNGNTHWKFTMPAIQDIVSPIGGGDCATAVMTRRFAENCDECDMPQAFAEALACASASCLTDTPSVFSPVQAQEILSQITVSRLSSTLR